MSEEAINPEQELEEQLKKELDRLWERLEEQEDPGLMHCFREGLSEEDAGKEADIYIKSDRMNNFWCRFPGTDTPGAYRSERFGWNESWWDESGRDEIMKNSWNSAEFKAEKISLHTAKWLDETPRQFLAELLKAIDEAGVDITKIHEFVDGQIKIEKREKRDDSLYVKYFWPVYKKMRLKGYNHLELFQ